MEDFNNIKISDNNDAFNAAFSETSNATDININIKQTKRTKKYNVNEKNKTEKTIKKNRSTKNIVNDKNNIILK